MYPRLALFLTLIMLLMGSAAPIPEDDPELHFNRGVTLLRQGEFIKAISEFTTAINLNNSYGEAYYQRALAKKRLSEKNGFPIPDLVVDLIMSAKCGYTQALSNLKDESDNTCYRLKQASIIPDEVFCGDFSSSLLSEMPPQSDAMSQMVNLNLYNNKFETFPREICEYPFLVVLHLNSNYLKSVPSCIKTVPWLMDLNLSRNSISSLPDEISQLQFLETLNLSKNRLTTLPANFHQLRSLRHLDLSYNEISDLPEGILRMTWLETINLMGNPIPKDLKRDLNKNLKDTEIFLQ